MKPMKDKMSLATLKGVQCLMSSCLDIAGRLPLSVTSIPTNSMQRGKMWLFLRDIDRFLFMQISSWAFQNSIAVSKVQAQARTSLTIISALVLASIIMQRLRATFFHVESTSNMRTMKTTGQLTGQNDITLYVYFEQLGLAKAILC